MGTFFPIVPDIYKSMAVRCLRHAMYAIRGTDPCLGQCGLVHDSAPLFSVPYDGVLFQFIFAPEVFDSLSTSQVERYLLDEGYTGVVSVIVRQPPNIVLLYTPQRDASLLYQLLRTLVRSGIDIRM